MESPPQVRKVMDQIHGRLPEAMLIALSIHSGTLPASAAAGREDVACSLRQLQSRARLIATPTTTAPRAPLRLISSSCYVPQHDEDSHFCHDVFGVVAVADGVGGCRAQGVDAAAFSRGLMENAFSEVATSELGKPVCPYEILERAYRRTAASGTPAASTAVVVSLAGRVLRWAYIGDSGFAVFRGGKMLRRFQPQQWYFNCPFQLCAGNGVTKVGDAAVGEMAVEDGDVLVVASDGLFDNVSDSALESLVRSTMLLGFTPEEVQDLDWAKPAAPADMAFDTVGVKVELTKNFEIGVSNKTAEFVKMIPPRKVHSPVKFTDKFKCLIQ
ncbi:hypothetical protein QYE76_010425 [Lolium multiflorum]|uniref:Protein phosphatase n=1 Tax=Lolium multiflorum TaxID=4521 RepID=A0AAD8TWZ9_LOLMU|nr:hypothetical protein QYE76_010425 [Lolium multiflorum]